MILEPQCKIRNCKHNAPWTCRTCQRPLCAYHSKNKVGMFATCGKCYDEAMRLPPRKKYVSP